MNKRRKRIKNWTFTLMSFTWVTDKSGTMLLYQRSSRTGIFSDFSFRLWTSSSLALVQPLYPELFIVLNCTVPLRDLSPTRAIGLVKKRLVKLPQTIYRVRLKSTHYTPCLTTLTNTILSNSKFKYLLKDFYLFNAKRVFNPLDLLLETSADTEYI